MTRVPGQPGPSLQELLDRETRPVPPVLRETRFDDPQVEVPVERYVSREWAAREHERMWPRVWQMACREEQIPAVGDWIEYAIGRHSLLLVRAAPDEIRAFHNACLHRGTQLRCGSGHSERLNCPFHGWTWRLDGSLAEIPCRWDFPDARDADLRLPEARVGRWGGFVFVNPDADAGSLEDYLGPLPAHFARWRLEDRHIAVYVAKEMAMNWKVGVEAFIESYHVRATHPQILPSTADVNTQYDVAADAPHVNRMITAMGVPSPCAAGLPEQAVADAMTGAPGAVAVPEGRTARELLGELSRGAAGAAGRDLSRATDSELLDAIQYFVFPNFFPWGGFSLNLVYRFRPVGDDPGRSLMEVMLLAPVPPGGERPPPAEMRLLGPDEDWKDAPELGILAGVFQQDAGNLPRVQRGLEAAVHRRLTLARYQESRIRHLHRTLSHYVEGEPPSRP